MSEGQIQDDIRRVLSGVPGLVVFRNNIGTADIRGYKVKFGVGGPGGADLICNWNGRFIAIEVKTPTGRQSPDQKLFQQLIERTGGEYVILRSVDDAKRWAESHG